MAKQLYHDGHACPLCGAAIHDTGSVLLDLDGGLVVKNGHVANLTRQEMAMFIELWAARPRTLSKEVLLHKIYGLLPTADEPEIKIIDVFVCKIRKKLLPLDLKIATVWALGYRIETDEAVDVEKVRDSVRAELTEFLA